LNRSHYAKLALNILGVGCYVALFAPWFVLAENATGHAWLMSVFWRLGLVVYLGMGAAAIVRERLAPPGHERHAAILSALIGLPILYTLLLRPLSQQMGGAWLAWFGLGLGVWVMGLRLGSFPPDNQDMRRQLALGSVSLAACFIVAGPDIRQLVLADSLPFVLFWCIGAMVATALTRLAELNTKGGKQSPDFARFWPPLLIAVAAVCLVAALLLSVGAPVMVWAMSGPARFVWQIMKWGLMLVAYALGYVLQAVVWIINLFLVRRGHEPMEVPSEVAQDQFPEVELKSVPPAFAEIAKWVGAAVLVLSMVALATHYLLKRFWKPADEGVDEMRESYASAEALRTWAKARIGSAIDSIKRMGTRSRLDNATQIYNAVLLEAQRRGFKKRDSQTAHSFQPSIRDCFPEQKEEADLVLRGFSLEYYAEKTLEQQLMHEIKEAHKMLVSRTSGS